MAKLDITCAVTVNYQTKTIDFMKLSAGLSDIDLDVPMETQLETFSEKFGYAYNELGEQIREKLKSQYSKDNK